MIQAQSREVPLMGCEGSHFYVQPTTRPSGFGLSRRPPPRTSMNARFPGGIQRSGGVMPLCQKPAGFRSAKSLRFFCQFWPNLPFPNLTFMDKVWLPRAALAVHIRRL
jgi:hypothetical protein